MKIIEKIEVKHFRSFLGTPKQFEAVATDLLDLNIFSGANDSGKSNILRALNLFFNDEISSRMPLDFDRDFFISNRESNHKVIEIGIFFDLSRDIKRDKFLPERFKISKFYDRNGFRNYLYSFSLKGKDGEIKIDSRAENNEHIQNLFVTETSTEQEIENARKREWNYRVKFSGFLNKSVSYEYIPAIRDTNFFAQLFGRVITRLKANEDNKIEKYEKEKDSILNWKSTIKNKTIKSDFKVNIKKKEWRKNRLNELEKLKTKEGRLSTSIKKLESEINEYSENLIKSVNFLDSEFKIGKNLRDFFEGFDVGTGITKSVSLKLRGDGIQAKFVPKILDFLSSIDSEKKYFIWGFEEPENSAEYKNQQELAKEFKEKFINKQIFITTHSEEFLQLYDGLEIEKVKRTANLYHVKKMSSDVYGEYSFIFLFDVDKNEFDFANQKTLLDDDLGQSYLRAKYSKEIKEREDIFLDEKKLIQTENNKLKNIIKGFTKPLLFVEDTYDQLYKIAWLKLFGKKKCNKGNFLENFNTECKFLIRKAEGASNLAGFLRQSNIQHFENNKVIGLFDFDQEGVKQFKCLENETYWNKKEFGDKYSGICKKRQDHNAFFSMLIPVPNYLGGFADLNYPSFVEIENLLPTKFLLDKNFASQEPTTGNSIYIKIDKTKKPKIWEEALSLTKKDYENFIPLFSKVSELFGL